MVRSAGATVKLPARIDQHSLNWHKEAIIFVCVLWYVCVVDMHSALKCYFLDLSSRKGYWVTISRRSGDCRLTMQVSCLKSKPNLMAGSLQREHSSIFFISFFLSKYNVYFDYYYHVYVFMIIYCFCFYVCVHVILLFISFTYFISLILLLLLMKWFTIINFLI